MTTLCKVVKRVFKRSYLLKHHDDFSIFTRHESSLVPKRVLVLAKVSRYSFERLRQPELSESQLQKKLIERGTDYEAMYHGHLSNDKVIKQVVEALRQANIEHRLMDRLSIDKNSFDWADFILPVGGDGTFLLASNLIFNNEKPIIGVNSDPQASEGYLMLPSKYSHDIPRIFEQLKAGSFKYLMRTRIRTTLKGDGIWKPSFHMHEKCLVSDDERYKIPNITAEGVCKDWYNVIEDFALNKTKELPNERRLPWLALNEVFMAESLAARTSSLLIKVDDEKTFHKTKSSGLIVSTGTGSTSWYKANNSICPSTVNSIMKIANGSENHSKAEIDNIIQKFNESLVYKPDDPRIAYSIRDVILNGTRLYSSSISSKGFCKSMTVRSLSFDASLVMDGGIAIPYSAGTTAVLETRGEDALRTIMLID